MGTCKTNVLLPVDAKYDVSTIDFDMVIEGVEYDDLVTEKRPTFIQDLAEEVRQGVNPHLVAPLKTDDIDKIYVAFYRGTSTSAVGVLVKVPTDPSNLAGPLSKQIQDDLSDIYNIVQIAVKDMA